VVILFLRVKKTLSSHHAVEVANLFRMKANVVFLVLQGSIVSNRRTLRLPQLQDHDEALIPSNAILKWCL